jgi:hypothetical protein
VSDLKIVERDGVRGVEVIAKAKAFFGGVLLKPGDAAFIPISALKVGDQLPTWAVPATPTAKGEVLRAEADKEKRFAEGAVAASGSKGNAAKRSFVEFVKAGGKQPEGAAQAAVDSSGGAASKVKMAELKKESAQADLPSVPESLV